MIPYNELCHYNHYHEKNAMTIEGHDYHFLQLIADSRYRYQHPTDLNAILDLDEVDINLQSLCRSHRGDTALMLAIKFYPALVPKILKKKPNLEIKNEFGETALSMAFDSPDIFEQLVKAGANVNVKDAYGMTALISIMHRNYSENVIVVPKILLEHPNCDFSMRDNDGSTALQLAINKYALSEQAFTSFLAQHKAEHINAQDDDGNTLAMHILKKTESFYSLPASQGHPARVMQLIQRADIDVSLKNKNGQRLLLVALDGGNATQEMIWVILNAMRHQKIALSIEEQRSLMYYAFGRDESFLENVLPDITDPEVLVAGINAEMKNISHNASLLHNGFVADDTRAYKEKEIETQTRKIVTILQSGVDIRTKDKEGNSALHVAFSLFDIPWSVRGRLLWMTARNSTVNMTATAVDTDVMIRNPVIQPMPVLQEIKASSKKPEIRLDDVYPSDNTVKLLNQLGCKIFSSYKQYYLTSQTDNADFKIETEFDGKLCTSKLLFMGENIITSTYRMDTHGFLFDNSKRVVIHEDKLPELVERVNTKKNLRLLMTKHGYCTSKPEDKDKSTEPRNTASQGLT